jgi:hypothetical protein
MENCDDAYGFPPYPLIATFLHTRRGVDLRDGERRRPCRPAALRDSAALDLDGLVAARPGRHGHRARYEHIGNLTPVIIAVDAPGSVGAPAAP